MNPQTVPNRRTILKSIGGGLLAGEFGPSLASAQPDELSQQLNAVRAATRTYKDIQTARADGYAAVSPYV